MWEFNWLQQLQFTTAQK